MEDIWSRLTVVGEFFSDGIEDLNAAATAGNGFIDEDALRRLQDKRRELSTAARKLSLNEWIELCGTELGKRFHVRCTCGRTFWLASEAEDHWLPGPWPFD